MALPRVGRLDRMAGTVGDVVMKKLLLTVMAVIAVGAFALPVAAQDDNTTSYDFEDDLVQGDLVRPDGENLMVRRRGARESLIRIREHFIPELLKSVENL